MKWNKGSILKAAVDYIRTLQNEQAHFRKVEQRNKEMEAVNKKLLVRVEVSVEKKLAFRCIVETRKLGSLRG